MIERDVVRAINERGWKDMTQNERLLAEHYGLMTVIPLEPAERLVKVYHPEIAGCPAILEERP